MADAAAPDPRFRACRVVVDGDEDETFLVCLTCDPGREVCCGHHLAPHDENGCHEQVASLKCQCTRRPKARAAVPDPRFRDQLGQTVLNTLLWSKKEPNSGELALEVADALMPTIAAEVEARVQDAANQRAAEDFSVLSELVEAVGRGDHVLPGAYRRARQYVRDRAATLDAEAGPSAG